MGTWVAVKVEFEAEDEQLGLLKAVAEGVEGSEVRLEIITPSGPDPRLVSGGVRDATGGPGLKAHVKIVEVRP